jgi:tRNA (cytidine/uridine-2'-O-)-methyltransferase
LDKTCLAQVQLVLLKKTLQKLAKMPKNCPMLHLVLVHPQIPPNTGNIARTCAATGTRLHLVGPLGFEISDRQLKRAGLDYWPHVDLHYHTTLDEFQQHYQQSGIQHPGRQLGFSTSGVCNYIQFQYQPHDWLLFGCETSGLPRDLLAACDQTLYIPMSQPHVRSLNLSVSAAIGLFEARRQLGYLS